MDAATGIGVAAEISLQSVYKVTAKSGKAYYYAWKGRGAPRLHEEPGSPAFIAELAAALAERKIGDRTRISGLCAMWRASDAWTKPRAQGGLADSTKKNWRPFLDDIQAQLGDLRIANFERKTKIRPVIRKWIARRKANPRQADMAKQVLSALMTFAVNEDLLGENPCIGLPNLYRSNRADRIWMAEDLERLEKAAPAHVMRVARLAALTGLRQSDLLKLAWSRVGDLAIETPTGKSGARKAALIPIYAELREALDAIPKTSTVVLVNSDGLPWKSGFTSSWNKALIKAGLHDADLHFHDLRGTAATRMYRGGLTIREIAGIMAWGEEDVERLIDRYVKRDELLKDRIERLDENARERDRKKTEKKSPAEIS